MAPSVDAPGCSPSFQSVHEELEFYKKHARELEETLAETRYTLEEFQLSSKELEEELEKEIDSTERRYNEIKIRNEAMRQEVDDWKEKYHQAIKESNVNINQLTRQLDTLKQQTEMFMNRERELEQDNDDLERTERAAKWSLQELERKYNVALERTAILEGEVSAKAAMAEEVQRLKDELRDANVELAVMKSNQQSTMKNHSTSSLSSYSGSTSSLIGETTPIKSPLIGSHEAMPSLRARLAKNSALQRSSSVSGAQSTLRLPPGAVREAGSISTGTINTPHQNPVKMVQEMVGRVKSLEARLVSCRSLVTPLLQPPPSYSTSIPPSGRSSHGSTGSLSSNGSRPGSPNYSSLTSPKVSRRTSMIVQQQLAQQRALAAASAASGILSS
ncbi:NADH:ubiquinone oxidoreductase [Podila horticola]|nr:NADH:ubiquinone oxidoreductase [Podila horticola]